MSTDTPTTSPTAPPRPGGPSEEFFSRIRQLGVVRPDEGRWAAGVAAGLARRWGVDPLLVRGAFVALSVLGGAGIALYGLCWLFLPHPDGRIHAQEAMQGHVSAGFFGAVIAILTNLPTTAGWGWHDGPFGWQPGGLVTVILVGAAIWYFANRHGGGSAVTAPGQTPAGTPTGTSPAGGPTTPGAGPADPTAFEPPAPGTTTGGSSEEPAEGTTSTFQLGATGTGYRPDHGTGHQGTGQQGHSYPAGEYRGPGQLTAVHAKVPDVHAPSHALTQVTLGIAALTALGVALFDRLGGGTHDAWLVGAALALGVVALGLVAAGLLGRRGGGLVPIAILLAIVSVNGAALRGSAGTVGERVWKPTSVVAAQAGYELGAGDAVLDLTDPAIVASTTAGSATAGSPLRIAAHMGVGQLRIVVPDGVPVEVDATVGLGQINDTINKYTEGGGGNEQVIRTGGATAGTTTGATSGTPARIVVTAELGLGNLEVVPQGTVVTTGGTK